VPSRSPLPPLLLLLPARRHRTLLPPSPHTHTGANYIRSAATGAVRALLFGDRAKAAADLRIGDVVERHLMDGDPVLFNRQVRRWGRGGGGGACVLLK